RLWAEYKTDDLASGICAEALANQLAVHLLRNYSTQSVTALPIATSKLSPKALQRALDYIEANLSSDLTIAGIANVLSMSVSHFAHGFKSSTGVAPHFYVMERRIEQAKILLGTPGLSVANVAHLCGFSTHSHFSVTFQRLTGKTPTVFRREA